MEPREALFVGFLTSHVGIAFRGMELMNVAGKDLTGELATRVATRTAELRAHNAQTIDNVLRVDAILGKNHLTQPPKPRTLDDYILWAGAASKATGAAVAPESKAAAGLLAGGFFGDIAAAAMVGVFTLDLLEAAPTHQGLLAEATRTAHQLAEATTRLETALRHPALPAAARASLEAAIAAARRTPAIDGNEPLATRLAATEALVVEINRLVPQVNAAF
jgi:hypothetical protein